MIESNDYNGDNEVHACCCSPEYLNDEICDELMKLDLN